MARQDARRLASKTLRGDRRHGEIPQACRCRVLSGSGHEGRAGGKRPSNQPMLGKVLSIDPPAAKFGILYPTQSTTTHDFDPGNL
jgi:hypothetical protein